MDAAEVAERLVSKAREVASADPEHAECSGAFWDPEYGAVCGCGVILGGAEEVQQRADLPPSQTTADAEAAPQAKQEHLEHGMVSTEAGIASAVPPGDPITSALTIIDPTQPYDSRMVEEHMLDVMARLERGAHYQRVCEEDAYNAALAYEMAYAKALLEADRMGGAADVRAARAKVACEVEYVRKLIADMKVRAIRETMHSLRSVLSGYQSVAKSISSTYSGGGSPGPAF